MCGIAGLVNFETNVSRVALQAMNDAMVHRGPDDAGLEFYDDGRVGLAHRRLAIIDLSAAGHQPMHDNANGNIIVFNGEIYNFQILRQQLISDGVSFNSASDTEVILKAFAKWGADCVKQLEGMFAYTVYCPLKRTLTISRDRSGEKPFYYFADNKRLAFASELSALLTHPAVPKVANINAVHEYLAYGYVSRHQTMLNDVHKLLPGHTLEFNVDTGALKIERYWELAQPPLTPRPQQELVDEFEGLLEQALTRQLVADVPVGVLLSGGLDSSLIAAIASKVSPEPINTFTVGFPGEGAADESAHAQKIADHYQTNHRLLPVPTPAGDFLLELCDRLDEPMADPSVIPTYLLAKLVREHVTVAIGGDGGDELFGGYLHYSRLSQHEQVRRWLPGWLRQLMAATAKRFPVGVPGRNHVMGFNGGIDEAILAAHLYFDSASRQRLLGGSNRAIDSDAFPKSQVLAQLESSLTPLQRATRLDFNTYMVDDVLAKVDRASMLNSLEVRAPFLDIPVIEYAFGQVPDDLKVGPDGRKLVVQALAKKVLPASFDFQRKQGFSVPQRWFQSWSPTIQAVLKESFWDQQEVDSLLDGQRNGRPHAERLFALTMLSLWFRKHNVSFG